MSHLQTSTVVFVFIWAACSSAWGGKLSSVREQARSTPVAKPTPSESAPSESVPKPTSSEPKRPRREPSDNRPAPRTADHLVRRSSDDSRRVRSGAGKLASVAAAVRPAPPRTASRPRPNRPQAASHGRADQRRPRHDSHRRPRPSRSPFSSHRAGFFWGHGSTPIIEEHHHIYEAPTAVSITETYSDPAVNHFPYGVGTQLQTDVVRGLPSNSLFLDDETVCEGDCVLGDVPQQVVTGQDAVLDPFHVRFEIDYTSDVDDVARMGFGLLANVTGGLGIDTGIRLFREEGVDFRDQLWAGDFNIVYELAPTRRVRPRAGIGVNWLADRWGSDAGLNLTVGADVLAGPVVFTGELDFGTLGEADLFHGRLTAGIRAADSVEWYAGYDYLDIGGVEFRGIVGGLRFRF